MKKILSILLSIAMMCGNYIPAAAATTTELTNSNRVTSTEMEVNSIKNSTFTVGLPVDVTLDNQTKSAEYQVSVKGDIDAAHKLVVKPEQNTYQLNNVTVGITGRDSVTANVLQEKTSFSFTELNPDTAVYTLAQTSTDAALLAGKWKGNINYRISLTSGMTAGLYDETMSVMTKSWDELINEGILDIADDGTVSALSYKDYANYRADYLHGVLVLDDSVTKIADQAFYLCFNLKSIVIPNSVTSIGEAAFESSGLEYISLPDSITSVSNKAFYNCDNLQSVQIPESVESIGAWAFYNCNNLFNLAIPDSATSIDSYAFYNVANIAYNGTATDVNGNNWGAYNKNLPSDDNFIYEDAGQTVLYKCYSSNKIITVPSTVQTIRSQSFVNKHQITIPDTVTEIEANAFWTVTNFMHGYHDEDRMYYNSRNIIYNGTAVDTNSDKWGAVVQNGVIKNDFLYEDESGTVLVEYLGNKEYVEVPNTVTTIKAHAFGTQTEVVIPDTVTSIENDAFIGREGYISDYGEEANTGSFRPYSVYNIIYHGLTGNNTSTWGAYTRNCYVEGDFVYTDNTKTELVSYHGSDKYVEIPDSVESIKSYAVTGRTQVVIPDSVTNIENKAFAYSENIIYNGTAEDTNDDNWGASYRNANIVNGMILTNNNTILEAYVGSPSVRTITVPDGILECRANFGACTLLQQINLPDGLKKISSVLYDDEEFVDLEENHPTIECLTIPDSVEYIESDAFKHIVNILYHGTAEDVDNNNWGATYKNAVITNGVVVIDETYALKYIGNASNVVIPDGVTELAGSLFANNTTITSIVIPEGVKTIPENAFYRCTNLQSVTLPQSLETIGFGAFSGCTNLQSITIPSNLNTIESQAFYNCSNLFADAELHLPDTLTTIGSYAFYNNNIEMLYVPDSVTQIGSTAFSGTNYLIYYGTATNSDKNSPANWGAQYRNMFPDGDYLYEDEQHTILKKYIGPDTNVVIPNNVTSIGDEAFYNCASLTSVSIPSSVTSIGDYAFYGCTSLASINIPDSVTSIGDDAFYNCKSLTSVTIPSSVTSIGYSAFGNCTSLSSIVIPNSVTSLGSYMFANCSSLTSVTIPNSVTSIDSSAFSDCTSLKSINIPSSVTSIGSSVFNRCTLLSSIILPDSVTSIGDYAFSNCTSLASINIPDGVTKIGSGTFSNCTSLSSIDMPNSATSIGGYAFKNCTSLASIDIPNGVTSIGSDAFEQCTALTSIVLPDSVTSIGDYAFKKCTLLGSINIPNGVTKISYSSFNGCTSLSSIDIPNSVTSIGGYAFYGCTSLASVTIPNSVTYIDMYAFENCTSLASVDIPDSVTTIRYNAFYKVPHITYNGTATGSPWGAKSIN